MDVYSPSEYLVGDVDVILDELTVIDVLLDLLLYLALDFDAFI